MEAKEAEGGRLGEEPNTDNEPHIHGWQQPMALAAWFDHVS
jgi:hypothetical protein